MNQNKTILITGSGTGIGKELSIKLIEIGYKVIATTYTEKQAEDLEKYFEENNLKAKVYKLDITKLKDRKLLNNEKIEILINNGAIGETGSLSEIDLDKVRKIFETNLFSQFEISQIALRKMFKEDKGRIIFISSIASKLRMPFLAPYSMTKAALTQGALILRKEITEINPNIKISVIEPGAYHTGFNQKMMKSKFEWMDKNSYFYKIIEKIRNRENRSFELTEQKKLDSIINQIIKAIEDTNPKKIYTAPFYQAFFAKIFNYLNF